MREPCPTAVRPRSNAGSYLRKAARRAGGRFLEEAVEFLEKAREIRSDPEVAAHLGEVLWVMGDRDGARDVWDSALRDTPNDKKLLDVIERLTP